MNSTDFTNILKDPSLLKAELISDIENISKEFPYFQPARALLIKGLKNQNSTRYNQELKVAAAYTKDREILFDFITSHDFEKNTLTSEMQKEDKINYDQIKVVDPEELKTMKKIDMKEAISMKIEEAEHVLNPELFSEKEALKKKNNQISEKKIQNTSNINQTEESKPTPEEVLEIDKPLEFDKKEVHSFSEWLKLKTLTPINREEDSISTQEKTDASKDKKFKLIDQFIAKNPKIKPADTTSPTRNLAKEHLVSTDQLMTETLAKVYIAQKNYKKAIQAYKILILKNPEKSGFFADQIRAIKSLKDNK